MALAGQKPREPKAVPIRSKVGLLLCLLLVLCVGRPTAAQAYFYDYSLADPFSGAASRSQDSWNSLMASMGEVILPDEVPDGTYNIEAVTTSTMCWIYPSASECSARAQYGAWGRCVLTVSGGTMTVHFYISQAYTHLRWGNAIEAASTSSADGMSGEGYIAGNPSSGYVPHYFALQIPALNWPMDIATYGGNNADFASSKWWYRYIAFKATDEVYAAMGGTTPEPDNPTPPGGGGNDYSDIIDDINKQIAGRGQAGSASSAEPSASQSDGDKVSSGVSKRGVLFNGVTFDQNQASAGTAEAPELSATEESGRGLSPQEILLLAGLGAVAVGIAYRSLSFARGKR